MTRFEYLNNEKNKALYKARIALKNNDKIKAAFYLRASEGFDRKMAKLNIEQAGEIIC